MCFTGWKYFYNIYHYLEWILFHLSIIFVVFVFINDCGCPFQWQWQVGIVSVFLGWINLIFLMSNIPVISLYVIMFREIFFTFSTLIVFAVVLISAFSLVLFMMFHDPTSSARVCGNYTLMVVNIRSFTAVLKLKIKTSQNVHIFHSCALAELTAYSYVHSTFYTPLFTCRFRRIPMLPFRSCPH